MRTTALEETTMPRTTATMLVALLFACAKPHPQLSSERIARSAVMTAAAALYSETSDPARIAHDAAEVFAAVGIPLVTDPGAIAAKRQAGAVFAITPGIDAIADGFQRGALVGLDSFLSDLSAKGLRMKDGSALTRASLAAAMAPVLGKETISRTELLPALVLALGQERARLSPPRHADPVFGDDRLDPLQHALLYSAIRTLADHPTAVAHARRSAALEGLGETVGDIAVEALLDFVGRVLGVPIGPVQSLGEAVCAPIYLWGHKVKLDLSPDVVNLRQVDVPERPYQSHMQALLVFDLKPYDDAIRRTIRVAAGCGELPEPGPVAGKKVEWILDEELETLGSLADRTGTTASDGTVRATYEAHREPVPEPFRVPGHEKIVAGTVEASASGILPEFPLLEMYEKAANDLLNDRRVLLVKFYEMPTVYLHFDSTVKGSSMLEPGDSWVMQLKSVIPLLPVENAGSEPPLYSTGESPFSYALQYTSASGCTAVVGSSPVAGNESMRAAIVPSGLAETMPLLFTPGMYQETYQATCAQPPGSFTTASFPLARWATLHISDFIPSLGYFYRLEGWTSPEPGVLELDYDRQGPLASESAKLMLSMTP